MRLSYDTNPKDYSSLCKKLRNDSRIIPIL